MSRPSPDHSESTAKLLVVSFHDLHVGNYEICQSFLDKIRSSGIDRTCLLTVPRWQGGERACDNSAFRAWIRQARDAGHEIVQHGYTHVDDSRLPLNPAALFMARIYTDGEGEFYRIDKDLARHKIEAGRRIMTGCLGQAPAGFVAPAWLIAHDCIPLLKELGLAYTTTLDRIIPFDRGPIRAPAISISARSALRRKLSELWIRRMEKIVTGSQILRIAVHPCDLEYEALSSMLFELIARSGTERRATTYHSIVEGVEI
jgi:uncharacterized protein